MVMSLTEHAGLSEEDVRAAEVLDVLRNSHGSPPSQSFELRDQEIQDHQEHQQVKQDLQVPTLLDRVRRNSIINNVVSLYEMNTRKRSAPPNANVAGGLGSLAPAVGSSGNSLEDSNALEDEAENSNDDDDDDYYGYEDDEDIQAVSKRQKISEAIAKSRGNLKEYQLNMSIGSKKRLIACLHLLKLANKQLTQKVAYLQEQVESEKSNEVSVDDGLGERAQEEEEDDDDDDDDEEYFDASESIDDDKSTVIKMEVVGTVKKVYSLISKFAGNSLPEPARTQVRQTLLNLPTNWSLSANNSSSSSRRAKSQRKPLTTNGKVLILAEESLSVVRNVMNVVDSSLGKAEEWVKQKQELKEILKERFIQQQWKKQVRNQLTKEKEEEERSGATNASNAQIEADDENYEQDENKVKDELKVNES
ncbi:ZYRO0E05918p [Zygosaccharomyces rouxii]|uniref:ZYRO0E05918p n=1 Tax=Zygosaccharomyces rouxii (strain ATCC 2623 / CBS 732 / NBRC 1130 / NCYC 568 / NRRL Y-229) TaxID=559307 RepID=C5E4H1_ZYGRC|nr:uncharacterized protein ZYRO0E05918g [Zygosaccharomyces rouxii]KAH9198210.1 transcription factor Opi1-domain-containing protein [Zygosaccharomyces rouxii]CAR30932.1 ZYRO0E05918p [Zygosaccharomyces rouxii]